MKMNKILLSAVLLISARAFAMEPATTAATAPVTQAVKTGLIARAKNAAVNYWHKGAEKLGQGARNVWASVPGKSKVASLWTWTTGKGATASNWVSTHIPARVKNTLTNKRNLKIAGAAAAIATVATCWHFFGDKLMSKKAATN